MKQLVCLTLCMSMSSLVFAQADVAGAQPVAPIPPAQRAPSGLTLIVGFGFGLALGNFYTAPSDTTASQLPGLDGDVSLEGSVSRQFPFSLGVGYRPIPLLSFGLAVDYASVSVPGGWPGSDVRLGGELRFHFMTDHSVSPCVSLGLGYESLSLEKGAGTEGFSGYEIDLQAGGDVHVTPNWTIGPYVDLRVGSFGHVDTHYHWRGSSPTSDDIPDADRATHEWLTFGVRGTFTSLH